MNLDEIKRRQRGMWSSGDYAKIAWVTAPLGDVVCDAVDLRPGSRVLDVACGTGHGALAAARRFCDVTGIDYVPALLDVAARRAEAEGLPATFAEGDAEAIAFPQESFDVVLSTIGVMFAPDQDQAARELLRVCRPGGSIGLVNWSPTGFLGELFRLIGRYVPPAPETKPPALWGTEERVRELIGGSVSHLAFKPGTLTHRFRSPDHYVDFYVTYYGPTLKAFDSLDQDRQSFFLSDLKSLVERFNRVNDGTAVWDADYLVVIATKAHL